MSEQQTQCQSEKQMKVQQDLSKLMIHQLRLQPSRQSTSELKEILMIQGLNEELIEH